VLVADDSEIFSEAMASTLLGAGGVELSLARDGAEAVRLTCDSDPDVVLMDIHMPVMSGLEAIRQIMLRCPTPILVMTSASADELVPIGMEALACGALEVVAKPTEFPMGAAEVATMVERLRLLAAVPVVRHPRAARQTRGEERAAVAPRVVRAIGIASSSGGPSALAKIFAALPTQMTAPIVIAQHLDAEFGQSLATWLDGVSARPVRVAEDGTALTAGTAWVIPPAWDAEVTSTGVIRLVPPTDAQWLGSPSGDRLLHSIADSLGKEGCGVVLTGMGKDGAAGLLAIRQRGGLTIAQDGVSSAVDGMPRAAREREAASLVLGLREIAPTLERLVRGVR
jgi:two-component system chemotaxis response regulator CheB